MLVCVPSAGTLDVAGRAWPFLRDGALYADLSSAAPGVKQKAEAVVARGGGRYVDGAVLGAVAAAQGQVPILAVGPAAQDFADLAGKLGLVVTATEAPTGAAARVKLLRSVYLKGRDALIAEMVSGADAHGLRDTVLSSIRGPGEEVAFPDLAARVMRSLDHHARRRADELHDAADVLTDSGVEPLAARGAEARLRKLAEPAAAAAVTGQSA